MVFKKCFSLSISKDIYSQVSMILIVETHFYPNVPGSIISSSLSQLLLEEEISKEKS